MLLILAKQLLSSFLYRRRLFFLHTLDSRAVTSLFLFFFGYDEWEETLSEKPFKTLSCAKEAGVGWRWKRGYVSRVLGDS